jgi:hypothetical protein
LAFALGVAEFALPGLPGGYLYLASKVLKVLMLKMPKKELDVFKK